MTDKAQVYLSALQSGYRIDQYRVTTDFAGTIFQFAPANPNRIYIYIGNNTGSQVAVYIKLISGDFCPLPLIGSNSVWRCSMATEYSMPTMEYWVASAGTPGVTLTGLGIIKQ